MPAFTPPTVVQDRSATPRALPQGDWVAAAFADRRAWRRVAGELKACGPRQAGAARPERGAARDAGARGAVFHALYARTPLAPGRPGGPPGRAGHARARPPGPPGGAGGPAARSE